MFIVIGLQRLVSDMWAGITRFQAGLDLRNIRPETDAVLRTYLTNYVALRNELQRLCDDMCVVPDEKASFERDQALLNDFAERIEGVLRCLCEPSRGITIASALPPWTQNAWKLRLTTKQVLTLQHWISVSEGSATDPSKWSIVYQATNNGWDHANFCLHCDGKSQVLYLIVEKAKGWVFGAYASKGIMKRDSKWIDDRKAFVFSLTNPHRTAPIKLSPSDHMAYHSYAAPWIICFGSGGAHALAVAENADSGRSYNSTSHAKAQGGTFMDTTTSVRGDVLFTGAANFLAADIFAISTAA
jgi:hypothetical protein